MANNPASSLYLAPARLASGSAYIASEIERITPLRHNHEREPRQIFRTCQQALLTLCSPCLAWIDVIHSLFSLTLLQFFTIVIALRSLLPC